MYASGSEKFYAMKLIYDDQARARDLWDEIEDYMTSHSVSNCKPSSYSPQSLLLQYNTSIADCDLPPLDEEETHIPHILRTLMEGMPVHIPPGKSTFLRQAEP